MLAFRRIIRHDRIRRVLSWLAARYMRLVYATGRWTEIGGETPRRFWAEGTPYIGCFWHGRLMMMPFLRPPRGDVFMLISRHRDGQLIARTVSHFNIDTIAGSTSKGGSAALRAMVKAIKDGANVNITPDGPRGPRMRAGSGIVALARLSGAPILPATFAARRCWILGSWDRFVVPLPFSRGELRWGQPIEVPADADAPALEEIRMRVENELNDITRMADLSCDATPIPPDEAHWSQPDTRS